MRSLMILTTALLINSGCTTSARLVDGCFRPPVEPESLSVPPVDQATADDYRQAANTRTKELLIALRDYESARKCVEVFE